MTDNETSIFKVIDRAYDKESDITLLAIGIGEHKMLLSVQNGRVDFVLFVRELKRLFNVADELNDKTCKLNDAVGDSNMWVESVDILKDTFVTYLPRYSLSAEEFKTFIKGVIDSCPKHSEKIAIHNDLLAQAMSIWYAEDD